MVYKITYNSEDELEGEQFIYVLEKNIKYFYKRTYNVNGMVLQNREGGEGQNFDVLKIESV